MPGGFFAPCARGIVSMRTIADRRSGLVA